MRNSSSLTFEEISTVSKNILELTEDELSYLQKCFKAPKFRDSYEVTGNIIVSFILKITGTSTVISFLVMIYNFDFGNKTNTTEKNSIARSVVESLYTFITSETILFIFILLSVFIILVMYNGLSSRQKRGQVESLLPLIIEDALESSN